MNSITLFLLPTSRKNTHTKETDKTKYTQRTTIINPAPRANIHTQTAWKKSNTYNPVANLEETWTNKDTI